MSVSDAAQDLNAASPTNDDGLLEKFIHIALDRDLSFRARGVLLFLLTSPDQSFTAADISAAGGEGREAIRTALEELASLGYYKVTKVRGSDGKISTVSQISPIRGTFDASPAPRVVYFVERDGYVKIGTTTRLKSRLRTISQGGSTPRWMNTGPVNLLATIPGGCDREVELHRLFHQEHVEGEWFRDCPAIRSFINDLGQVAQ
ncbi:GIY-YIG nuclease family protein [Streptosporangium roseum]|uniref:GIY-YIG nuclease family protein n=1 Tax=Streptosporangium roseum TaxID=2001 RepID=UPI00331EE7D3